MATRSGLIYKPKEATMKGDTSLQEMMKLLIEDRRKREQEIAAERKRREDEIATERERQQDELKVERTKREEERKACEREMQGQMDEMRGQMEKLMKVVETIAKAEAKPVKELSVKLVALTEKDDIEAYLVTFERIMAAHKVKKDNWSQYLAPQLTGKAQLVFAALQTEDSGKYAAIKTAILARYDITEEAYRRRFGTATRKDGETNREVAVRLMDVQTKWLKKCTTVAEMQEMIGVEQFLNTLPMEKKLWVMEKKPGTCVKAGELADEYEQARRQVQPGVAAEKPTRPNSAQRKEQKKCGRTGHLEHECRTKKTAASGQNSIKCYNLKKNGHIAANCPNKQVYFCSEKEDTGVYRSGLVEGQEVGKILLDTGCSRTMVQRALVPGHKYLEGDAVTIRCAHGDTVLYPLAKIDMVVDGMPIKVEAAVSEILPVPVLLGTDVMELTQLLGGADTEIGKSTPEDVMVVVTRAQARKQLEEELLRRENEVRSGVKPNQLEESKEADPIQSTEPLTKEQRRTLRLKLGKKMEHGDDESSLHALEISASELSKLQDQDGTLAKVRDAADGKPSTAGIGFFKRGGLIFRRWTPPGRGEDMEIEQLVLPKECRQTVLELAHDIPLAGHLGKEKTRQRVLRRFYWPTVFKDVEEFCRCCSACQKTANRKAPPAPLIPLPIISEPFSRIAMDIVGPVPRSRAGNRYILVLCDYATRYPDAVPLKSIDAEHVAEELIKVFARVGVPKEILTDQGSNFTSQLLAELYPLLHVHPIRTSPYHPQTDGLVERFNQTLKAMLWRTATTEGLG
jgi:hypothetical protein